MKHPKKIYFFTLAIFALVYVFPAIASNMHEKAVIPEKFILHVVKPGDTIWDLSIKHLSNIDPRRGVAEIKAVNALGSHVIQPGDILSIPSIEGTLSEPLGPEYSSEEAAEETDAAGQEAMREARELQLPSRGGGRELTFEATAYTQRAQEGTADGITFTGTYARPGVIATDPTIVPLGSWLYVESDYPGISGYYRAEDIGGAIKGRAVDIYMKDLSRALEFGRREVKVVIVNAAPKTD